MEIDQLTQLAERGDVTAQYQLAAALNNSGQGPAALTWYERAAEAGHPDASVAFAMALGHGQFTKADPKRAVRFMKKAAKAGHALGRQALATAKIQGFGTSYDWDGAVDLLIQGAQLGEAAAMRQLATLLHMARDHSQALELFSRAASKDVFALGLLLRALRQEGLTYESEAAAIAHCIQSRFPLAPDLIEPLSKVTLWRPGTQTFDWRAIKKKLKRPPSFRGKNKEVLSDVPRILVYQNEIPPLVCDYILSHAAPQMKPAEIVDPNSGISRQDPYRRAKATTFAPLIQDTVISTMDRVLMKLSHLPFENGEQMGVLSYIPGEEYRPHYDCFLQADGIEEAEMSRGGQRVRTVLLVLYDDFQGGGTSFPNLGITILAPKGSVIVFDNVDEKGEPDLKSIHAGLPVTAGTKWIATKWIRANKYQ
jgi:prolyl 4-hydroxylase